MNNIFKSLFPKTKKPTRKKLIVGWGYPCGIAKLGNPYCLNIDIDLYPNERDVFLHNHEGCNCGKYCKPKKYMLFEVVNEE